MHGQSIRPRWSSRPRTVTQFWERGVRSDHLCEAVGTYCLDWTGGTVNTGYGSLSVLGKRWLSHRLAWTYTYGPIPTGSQVLHRCDRPICFEPTHLFLGTQADNMTDMAQKGRATFQQYPHLIRRGTDFVKPSGWTKRGADNTNAVLTEETVRDIRRLRDDGLTLKQIAAVHGVHWGTVWQVVNRKSWAHVP